MAYFELNDIKRDRIPYTSDFWWHRNLILFKSNFRFIYNTKKIKMFKKQ